MGTKNLLGGKRRHRFYSGYNFTYPDHFKHFDEPSNIYFIRHVEQFERNLKPLFDKPNICLEIGVWGGGASVWFLEKICKVPGSHLYMMDVIDIDGHDILQNNLLPYDNWTYIVGDSTKSFETFHHNSKTSDFLDFVYVDGEHTFEGAYRDMVNSFRCLKSGGIMCVDDYPIYFELWGGYSVKAAVDRFETEYSDKIDVIFESQQKWFIKK